MVVLNCSRMLFSMIAITNMFELVAEENIWLCKQPEIMNTWIHIINERYFMAIADLDDTPIAIRNSQSAWPYLTAVFVCALDRKKKCSLHTAGIWIGFAVRYANYKKCNNEHEDSCDW